MSSQRSLGGIASRSLVRCRDYLFPPGLARLAIATDGFRWIVKAKVFNIQGRVSPGARLSGRTIRLARSVERFSRAYRLGNLAGGKGEWMVHFGAGLACGESGLTTENEKTPEVSRIVAHSRSSG